MMPRHRAFIPLIAGALILCGAGAHRVLAEPGVFDASVDVGKAELPGSAEFDEAKHQYRISGSGENMWKVLDAFHFVYRKVSGDVKLSADVEFPAGSKTAHRKGGCMIRQTLDADSPYADVMVHGDGLIELQYRKEKGGITEGVKAMAKAPATVRLERSGDAFTLVVTPKDGTAETVGPVKLILPESTYVGLAVCSHDVKTLETAVFSKVVLTQKTHPPEPNR